MNTGWCEVILGDVCTFRRGLTYSKDDEVAHSSNAVLRANNINLSTAAIDLSEIRYISDRVRVATEKKVAVGCILICTASGSKSHLGKVALIREQIDAAFGGFMGLIVPKPGINPAYLILMLQSSEYREHLDGLSAGTNINNLRFDQLGKFSFPLPPLAEQGRIVAVLDEAFEAIATATANTEAVLARTDAVVQEQAVRLISLDSDVETLALGNLCDIYQPKTISRKEMSDSATYPVYGANGLIGRYHSFNHDTQQLLVTCRGATCGSVNVSEPNSWITGNSMVVRPIREELRVSFLKLIFEYAFDFASVITGAAQPQITRQSFAPARVRVPSVERQVAIERVMASVVAEVGSIREMYGRKLALLTELKTVLLARALSGELTAPEAVAA